MKIEECKTLITNCLLNNIEEYKIQRDYHRILTFDLKHISYQYNYLLAECSIKINKTYALQNKFDYENYNDVLYLLHFCCEYNNESFTNFLLSKVNDIKIEKIFDFFHDYNRLFDIIEKLMFRKYCYLPYWHNLLDNIDIFLNEENKRKKKHFLIYFLDSNYYKKQYNIRNKHDLLLYASAFGDINKLKYLLKRYPKF